MAQYRIEFAPSAIKQLASFPVKEQVRIASKIDALVSDPRHSGCVKLRDSEDIYRLRSGDHRILYQVKDTALFVLVIKVGRRGNVYKS